MVRHATFTRHVCLTMNDPIGPEFMLKLNYPLDSNNNLAESVLWRVPKLSLCYGATLTVTVLLVFPDAVSTSATGLPVDTPAGMVTLI